MYRHVSVDVFQTRPERGEFLKKITGLMFKMVEQFCPVDGACDQMGKQFLNDALPPVLTDGRIYIHYAALAISWVIEMVLF